MINRRGSRGTRHAVVAGRDVSEDGNVFNIDIEKPKINPVHFIAILGSAALAIAINAFALGGVWFNLTNSIEGLNNKQVALSNEIAATKKELSERFDKEANERKEREKLYQASLDNMNTQIGQIQPLQYQQTRMIEQLAESKNTVTETNKRLDRVVDSFGGKVDTLVDGVNKLTTRVEVINSKLDDAADKRSMLESGRKSALPWELIQPPQVRR